MLNGIIFFYFSLQLLGDNTVYCNLNSSLMKKLFNNDLSSVSIILIWSYSYYR